MDLCLIAAGWYMNPEMWIAILEVALGLGFVIFVHELGHFAVAKLCGVKIEKFYLGFDIGGLKLLKFRRGETEYGIGIVPLGGYVKMLGQEDNPARLREEMERARQKADEDAQGDRPAFAAAPGAVPAKTGAVPYDPRSFLAQSVPRRMAIISAGVIMNLIFALVLAWIAFGLGVKQPPCIIGQVYAGSGAWQAGLQPGDQVLTVNGQKVKTFLEMQEAIVLGDVENGVRLLVQRSGVAQPIELLVKTQRFGGRPGIGVGATADLQLIKEWGIRPVLPGSPAADAPEPFTPNDRIVKINDQPLESYVQLQRELTRQLDKPVTVTVARAAAKHSGDGPAAAREVKIQVGPNPMRHLGLVMEMGPITAIQQGSPAETAGLQAGDVLRTVDNQPAGDPMTLPDRLRAKAGQTVVLGVERDGAKAGAKALEQIRVTLREVEQFALSALPGSPVAVPEIGLAYQVLNTVREVTPDGPAAKAGLKAGDVIHQAKVNPPDKETLEQLRQKYDQPELTQDADTVKLDSEHTNWPVLLTALQGTLPGTTVDLEWLRGEEAQSAKEIPLTAASDWFNANRGWYFRAQYVTQIADSFGEAIRRGTSATLNAAVAVYRSLHRVGTGQVSARNLGGPLTIFLVAKREAELGVGNLLLFLTLLSANLAVLNFLPIPLLDGGHMVLLLWEGIRGKPADERVQEVLTYVGLVFILGLMIFVLGLDFGLISRPGR